MLGIKLDEVVQVVFAVAVVKIEHKGCRSVFEDIFMYLLAVFGEVVQQVLLVADFLMELEVVQQSLHRRNRCEPVVFVAPLALLPLEVYQNVLRISAFFPVVSNGKHLVDDFRVVSLSNEVPISLVLVYLWGID